MGVKWIQASMAGVRRVGRAAMDFCYPGVCAACEIPCEGSSPLCRKCLKKLELLEAAAACPAPLPYDGAPCPHCLGRGLRPLDRIARLGRFDDPLRLLVHHFKYHAHWPLAEQLADRLWAKPEVRQILAQSDVIVPVPLYRWRQVLRGYNQAEVIAAQLSRRSGVRLARPAVRFRDTPTQTLLGSNSARRRNMRDAFVLASPRQIRGKRLTLVDDVMTTAATLRSLARVLHQGEPAAISAVVLAVADPRRRGFETI